jgi:hypothetical protein
MTFDTFSSALVNYEKFKSNEEPKFDPVFEEKVYQCFNTSLINNEIKIGKAEKFEDKSLTDLFTLINILKLVLI